MSTLSPLGTLYYRHYLVTILTAKFHIKAYISLEGILFYFFLILPVHAFPQSYNFRTFNSEDGLTQPYVYTIIQDARGYLWVGTGNGLSRFNGFVFENYPASDSLPDSFITCSINDGKCLWFGNYNGGLSCFYVEKNQVVNLDHVNLSSFTHFAKSPDGAVWASTYTDGLLKLNKDSGVVKHYMFNEQTIITSFDFLDNNVLLVGTNSGLFLCRLKGSGEIERIHLLSDIPQSKITCIHKMSNKSGFYIATENKGIFHLSQIYG